MSFILDFLNRNSKALLFIFLVLISVGLMFNSQKYHHSVWYRNVFAAQSEVNQRYNNVNEYFNLKRLNESLVEENERLKQENLNLSKASKIANQKIIDSAQHHQTYELMSAEVVNSVRRAKNNYYTLNVGKQNGLQEGLAVITNKGVVGHIALLDDEYALVLSALHPETRIKSKIKNTEYFGTLTWDGKDARIMQLKNIDKYIPVNINDTIETYRSTIFPEGIPIGVIIDKQVDSRIGKWDVSVQLFQDMNALNYVYVVHNLEKNKIDSLETRSVILDAE